MFDFIFIALIRFISKIIFSFFFFQSWPFIFNKSNTSNSPLTESESSDCQYSFQEYRSTNNLQSSNENVLHPNNPMNVQPTDFSFSNVQIDINYHDLNWIFELKYFYRNNWCVFNICLCVFNKVQQPGHLSSFSVKLVSPNCFLIKSRQIYDSYKTSICKWLTQRLPFKNIN